MLTDLNWATQEAKKFETYLQEGNLTQDEI